MFLGEPLPFALGLDPGVIDQRVQGTGAGARTDGAALAPISALGIASAFGGLPG